MACCKMGKYDGWCSGEQTRNFSDSTGIHGYCIFHAPKKETFADEFNQRVFDLLRDASESSSSCNLRGTVFPEMIEFDVFDRNMPFPETDFSDCSFEFVRFTDIVSNNNITFKDAKINKIVLSKCNLDSVISFEGAEIKRAFMIAGEYSSANFRKVEIGYAFFNNAFFKVSVEFTDAIIDKVLVRGKTFSDEGRALHLFTDIKILNYLRFENVCLKNVSFLYADVSRMEFMGCDWDRIGSRRIIFDENNPDISPKHSDKVKREHYIKVKDIYNRLKQKFKNEHNDGEASNWHWGEKEMWMLTLTWKDWHKWVLGLYRFFCGFGENPMRAGSMLLVMFIAIVLILSGSGMSPMDNAPSHITSGLDSDFGKLVIIFIDLFKQMTFQKDFYFVTTNLFGEIIKTLGKIIIPVQAAFFVMALRNRFRR